MLCLFTFLRKSIFLFIFLFIANCASAPPKWSRLPYKRSRVEGVGRAVISDFKNRDDAIEMSIVRARTQLRDHFRNDGQAQIKILGTTIEQTNISWSNIILHNSIIGYDWIGKVSGIEMAYAYAYISKGTNSPYTASFLSFIYPGLGQIYNEDFNFKITFLGTSLAAATIYSHLKKENVWDKYQSAENFSDITKYYDNIKLYRNIRNIAFGFYGIITLYGVIDAFRDAKADQDSKEIFDAIYRNIGNNLHFYYDTDTQALCLKLSIVF